MPATPKTGGYATLYDPDATAFNGVREYDTLRCQHCGLQNRFKGFERIHDKGSICSKCNGFLCPGCTAIGPCNGTTVLTFEDRLAVMEKRELQRAVEEVPLASRGYLLLPEGFTPRSR